MPLPIIKTIMKRLLLNFNDFIGNQKPVPCLVSIQILKLHLFKKGLKMQYFAIYILIY